MSLLSKFNIQADKYKVDADSLDSFARKSNTTTLVLDQRVKVPGSLNGIAIPTWATLRNADWHRITVRKHEINRAGEPMRLSEVVGLSFRNVKIDVEVEIDGQVISLQDFARQIASSFVNGETDTNVLDKVIADCGLNFDGMPMFLQQMGASENGFTHAIEIFKAQGGFDDMQSVRNNSLFHTAYAMPKNSGLKVTSLEMGSADRSQSRTGDGYVDLVDAVIGNFMRMWEHKSTIVVLKNKLDQSGLSQAEIKSINSQIEDQEKMIKNYGSSWSGAARQKDKDTGVEMAKYNPMNVLCGRWSALVNEEVVDFDVWSTSDKAPSGDISSIIKTPTIDTTQKPF